MGIRWEADAEQDKISIEAPFNPICDSVTFLTWESLSVAPLLCDGSLLLSPVRP